MTYPNDSLGDSATRDWGKMSAGVVSAQNRALHSLLAGAPLAAVFAALIEAVESAISAGSIGAILVLDDDGKRLRHGAAPNLPPHFNEAIDGLPIGTEVGTCGAAAARNEVVTTTDIATEPGWAPFRDLPLGLGLQSAWSMPIRNAEGKVLGTFGTYFRERREPTPAEKELVRLLSTTAAIAIEQRATMSALNENEAFLQNILNSSSDTILVLDALGRIAWVGDGCGAGGLSVGELWLDHWRDPVIHDRARLAVERGLAGTTTRFSGCMTTGAHPSKWWDVVVTPLANPGDRPRALLVVARDISELKRAQHDLERTELELRCSLRDVEGQVAERTRDLAESNSNLQQAMAAARSAETQRNQTLFRLGQAEESERGRISRELHDQVGQQLTALGLGLRNLQSRAAAAEFADWQELIAQVSSIENEVHNLALDLRPVALDDLGLAVALENAVGRWRKKTNLAVSYHAGMLSGSRFHPDVETAAYRIVLEALNNVSRHARATAVTVLLEKRGESLLAIVADDGIGFDPKRPPGQRLGLRGMRERAEKLGGTLKIETEPGNGATVCAILPWEGSPT